MAGWPSGSVFHIAQNPSILAKEKRKLVLSPVLDASFRKVSRNPSRRLFGVCLYLHRGLHLRCHSEIEITLVGLVHGSCSHEGQKPAITAAGLPLKRRVWMRLAVHVQHVDTEHIECPQCHKCPRPGSHIARAIAQARERGYTDLSVSPALPTDAARPRPCAILAPRLDL